MIARIWYDWTLPQNADAARTLLVRFDARAIHSTLRDMLAYLQSKPDQYA